MASDAGDRDMAAPLNFMEYTFSEEMLFVDTNQIQKLMKVFPNIKKRDIKPYVLLSLKEMKGETPKVGGIADMTHYVAIRTLVHTIYREAQLSKKHKASYQDVLNYLKSLKLSVECAHEVLDSLYQPAVYNIVPHALRLHPGLTSSKCLVDISYCETKLQNDVRDVEITQNPTALRKMMRVIVLLQMTDGKKKAIGIKWEQLPRFRLQISEALSAIEEAEMNLVKREETNIQNLMLLRSEGHF